jgi:hypothetical protein
MSSLSNQQINQSYQGLIKLENSTSGITQNLQSVQDGLGNDTGVRMGLNFFESPSQLTFQPLPRSHGGIGVTDFGVGGTNTNVNKLHGHFFFAQAGETYTGLTIGIGTVAAGDDSLEFAIYTIGKGSPTSGIAPKDLLMSGMTLSTAQLSTTGFKTMTFPTPLTFPYSGVYFLGCLIQSSGTPAVRTRGVNANVLTANSTTMSNMYGFVLGQQGDYINPQGGSATSTTFILYGGTDGPFLPSYDPEVVYQSQSSFNVLSLGFILNK